MGYLTLTRFNMRITRSIAVTFSFVAALLLLAIALANAGSSPGVSGSVVDSITHKAIEGAWVISADETTHTNSEGQFLLKKSGPFVGVRAVGYRRLQLPTDPKLQFALVPIHIRGLYLSFWGVGSQVLRNAVLDTARKAQLNAIVVDVKGDNGFVSHHTQSKLAIEAGANHSITMPNPSAFVLELHRRQLYAIARIVVFKDNPLARLRPDLAVKTGDDKLFIDGEHFAWTDPFNHAVWEYNIALAVEAAKEGFDEIQFDYVRFPDQPGLVFSKPNTQAGRSAAIVGFLAESRQTLNAYNVSISADNFGYVCWNLGDTGIGQSFAAIGPVVDYISPMLYPSSFQAGIPGLRNPLSDPYRIVYASLQRAIKRTGFAPVTFRPWLQAFDDYAFDHRKFGKVQIEAQIKAAQDSGCGWLLWDARNRYHTDILVDIARDLTWSDNPPPAKLGTQSRPLI
jgi:hypothetical protein